MGGYRHKTKSGKLYFSVRELVNHYKTEDWHVCVHEGGHIVTAAFKNVRVNGAFLTAKKPGWSRGGATMMSQPDLNALTKRDLVTVMNGGMAAEGVMQISNSNTLQNCKSDLDLMLDIAEAVIPNGSMQEKVDYIAVSQVEGLRLLSSPLIKEALFEVSFALYMEKSLSDVEIARIFGRVGRRAAADE